MKTSPICADGCVARSMLEQLNALRHDLENARLDINALFRQRLFTDRRRHSLEPTLDRRNDPIKDNT
jgi:hypothetical protein